MKSKGGQGEPPERPSQSRQQPEAMHDIASCTAHFCQREREARQRKRLISEEEVAGLVRRLQQMGPEDRAEEIPVEVARLYLATEWIVYPAVRRLFKDLKNPLTDDLAQEGCIALWRGIVNKINQYDPEEGASFSTYAYRWWVQSHIKRAIEREFKQSFDDSTDIDEADIPDNGTYPNPQDAAEDKDEVNRRMETLLEVRAEASPTRRKAADRLIANKGEMTKRESNLPEDERQQQDRDNQAERRFKLECQEAQRKKDEEDEKRIEQLAQMRLSEILPEICRLDGKCDECKGRGGVCLLGVSAPDEEYWE